MNRFRGTSILFALFAVSGCSAPASENGAKPAPRYYQVHYTISPMPSSQAASVEMRLEQPDHLLRELSFDIDAGTIVDIDGDGDLQVSANHVRWLPARKGGRLSWNAKLSNARDDGEFDALLVDDWGIFRAEDLIPRARTRTLKGSISKTTMQFDLPPGWSVITEYAETNEKMSVDNADRRFDQPSGWIAVGRLGVRRETIAGTRVAIAAPLGQSVRRMDKLALLNWTLPELNTILPDALPRLTIISADDPMWRGGLSAPASIYIHSDRPLISENATSTLLHETMHVAMDISAADGYDWIVEGLAEYYSLELLRRGGAITTRRYRRALEDLEEWAAESDGLCAAESKGPTTALAVLTFRKIDRQLKKASAGKVDLDVLTAAISRSGEKVSLDSLRHDVTELLQEPVAALSIDELPGCEAYVN